MRVARIHIWATEEQWKNVTRLTRLGVAYSEPEMGRQAGFTKGEWRDFYGRLRAVGALVPRGNGPRAGYDPAPWWLKTLQQRPWER